MLISAFCVVHYEAHEEKEAIQLSFYNDRCRLWCTWNRSGRLPILLSFLLSWFSNLLERHTKSGERFAQFLVSWHNFVGVPGVPFTLFCVLDTLQLVVSLHTELRNVHRVQEGICTQSTRVYMEYRIV